MGAYYVLGCTKWASNAPDRKSTSGRSIMHGSHFVKLWSKTESLVAVSTAESKFGCGQCCVTWANICPTACTATRARYWGSSRGMAEATCGTSIAISVFFRVRKARRTCDKRLRMARCQTACHHSGSRVCKRAASIVSQSPVGRASVLRSTRRGRNRHGITCPVFMIAHCTQHHAPIFNGFGCQSLRGKPQRPPRSP